VRWTDTAFPNFFISQLEGKAAVLPQHSKGLFDKKTKAKEELPFARCEFGTNLAVIYYSTNRKDAALQELESIRSLVNKTSRPDCQRSLFLLGSLYQEMNRKDEALNTFRAFLANTENSNDTQIINARRNAQNFVNTNR
jgi:tetratricopeptide (TPR) repeat protein